MTGYSESNLMCFFAYIDLFNLTADENKQSIDNAITQLENVTCLRFVGYTDQKSFVTFINKGDNCLSNIGRAEGENEIELPTDIEGQDCLEVGSILHEIMHNLGLDHMHLSPERDDFIAINWQNIQENQLENFDIISHTTNLTDFGLGYDFESLMHYQSKSFTTDDELHTMEARSGPEDTARMGNREQLSEGDVARLRAMYNCDGDRPEEDYTGIEENDGSENTTDQDE